MKKSFFAVLLIFIFCSVLQCCLITSSFCSVEYSSTFRYDCTRQADTLKALGLFSGSTNGYELQKTATRAEAAVMLVRLLGKSAEASAKEYVTPFIDVPIWASESVGYLYSTGLTQGVDATHFGSHQPSTVKQYCSFILRAMGYNDKLGDFTYNSALDKCYEIGVISNDEHSLLSTINNLPRGVMVFISYNALYAPINGSSNSLIETLISSNAVVAQSSITTVKTIDPALSLFITNFQTQNQSPVSVYAWGNNRSGNLGENGTEDPSKLVSISSSTSFISIAAGGYHSLALHEDGSVYTLGANTFGQLGTETLFSNGIKKVEGLTDIKQVVAGDQHSLALREDGAVFAWGYNKYGQLGIGNTTNQTRPVHVKSLSSVKAIFAGESSSFAISENGTAYAWGNNLSGQLGIGNIQDQYVPAEIKNVVPLQEIASGKDHTLALTEKGTILAWGEAVMGQLGLEGIYKQQLVPVEIPSLHNVKHVSAGTFHSAALLMDGTVYTWGHNSAGQLGIGNLENRPTPTLVARIGDITQIDTRWHRTAALSSKGKMFVWGWNVSGEIGNGDTIDQELPVPVFNSYIARTLALGNHHTIACVVVPPKPLPKPQLDYAYLPENQDIYGRMLTWKVGGYEATFPYKQYEVQYANNQITDIYRYTGATKPFSGAPIVFEQAYVKDNIIGVPEAHYYARNISPKDIDAFEVQIYCYDNYNRPVNHYLYNSNVFKGISQDLFPSGETDEYSYWTLYGYDNTTKIKIVLLSAHYVDGSIWKK